LVSNDYHVIENTEGDENKEDKNWSLHSRIFSSLKMISRFLILFKKIKNVLFLYLHNFICK
jgi:hypothetical protein